MNLAYSVEPRRLSLEEKRSCLLNQIAAERNALYRTALQIEHPLHSLHRLIRGARLTVQVMSRYSHLILPLLASMLRTRPSIRLALKVWGVWRVIRNLRRSRTIANE